VIFTAFSSTRAGGFCLCSRGFNRPVFFFPDGSSQVYTDRMAIADELLPGLDLTTRRIFEEAQLID
jgi:hypothetical protein